MWHRILRRNPFLASLQASGKAWRAARRPGRRPALESLEGRRLMTASLAPIGDVSAPAGQGYQLTLDGSAGGATDQIFTATSDNPNIKVAVADGQFWTINVQHLSSGAGDPTIINEPMTFQFFPDVAPQTVDRITNFSNSGYYVSTGRFFPRILAGFVAQGGSTSATSTASEPSGVPAINIEVNPAVAFSSYGQLAMANSGPGATNDAQFFVTFGPQSSLNQKYTIFGQQVSGFDTLEKLSQVKVSPAAGGENSVPDTPVTITGSTISAPTQNARSPAPVRMAQRIPSSRSTSAQAARSASFVSGSIALRRSGRLIRTTAIPSCPRSRSTLTRSLRNGSGRAARASGSSPDSSWAARHRT